MGLPVFAFTTGLPLPQKIATKKNTNFHHHNIEDSFKNRVTYGNFRAQRDRFCVYVCLIYDYLAEKLGTLPKNTSTYVHFRAIYVFLKIFCKKSCLQ